MGSLDTAAEAQRPLLQFQQQQRQRPLSSGDPNEPTTLPAAHAGPTLYDSTPAVPTPAAPDAFLGLLFHAKEYPRFCPDRFPYHLGYCQVGGTYTLPSH